MGHRKAKEIDATWLLIASRMAGFVSLAVAMIVILAWFANEPALQSFLEGLPTMKFNTALGLALLSLAGLMRTRVDRGSWPVIVIGWLVLALTVASIVQELFHCDLGIDTLLVADPASLRLSEAPGRMSLGTAIAMLLLAIGVLIQEKLERVGIAVISIAGLIGILSIIMFVGRSIELRQSSMFSSMALHTAHLITLICAAQLLTIYARHISASLPNDFLLQQMHESRPMILVVTITLLVALGVTATVVLDTQSGLYKDGRHSFMHLTDRVTAEIRRTAYQPVYGLHGARGVFAASKSVERLEFEDYVASRNLPEEFPGAEGFGFIERVKQSELADFIERERKDDAPAFAVKSLSDASEFYIAKYIYPLKPNQRAWGYDMGSEPVRREAIERAIRTGKPAISGRIELPLHELG